MIQWMGVATFGSVLGPGSLANIWTLLGLSDKQTVLWSVFPSTVASRLGCALCRLSRLQNAEEEAFLS